LYVGKYAIVYTSLSCTERQGSFEFCNFRPIPTKPDVERDQLLEILCHSWQDTNKKLDRIQQAGFTIPKKVKSSDVRSMVGINSSMTSYQDEVLIEEIFNLLGDLVEQDKGGAE
jgi:hypothetical protein